MSGKDRFLLAEHPHYLMRQSADNQPVFIDESDYTHCLADMRELSIEHGLAIHGYCLLPHSVHVLASPEDDATAVSRFMKALTCRASLRRKKVHRRDSAWETRYRSSVIEPGQPVITTMCYIERLPIVHELAPSAYHYRYSSYRMRLGKTERYSLSDPEIYQRLGRDIEERAEAYRTYVSNGLSAEEEKAIANAVKRCRLIGSVRFIKEVYRKYGLSGVEKELTREHDDA
ncbi:transposase [Alloalcanivorax sp. C16-2]|uniref:transposase n=1 Tax=Alloalcanivorax sp. C16-2 TaxID=3390052 RepID=UPI003971173A